MTIEREDVENLLESNGFERVREIKKVVEYRSTTNGETIYFRTEIGLPQYIRVVIHPSDSSTPLLTISGISQNIPKEFQYGSNMSNFPKRKNGGEKVIHYGSGFKYCIAHIATEFCSFISHAMSQSFYEKQRPLRSIFYKPNMTVKGTRRPQVLFEACGLLGSSVTFSLPTIEAKNGTHIGTLQ